jgi:hypothetical protein
MAAFLLLASLAAACGHSPGSVTQRDIARYLQQLGEWAPQEAEIARAVRRILATQFVDEAEVRHQMAESLPRIESQLTLMRAYNPHAAELEDIHQAYVAAWDGLRRGYADIATGLDTGDQAAIGRGRRRLVGWRQAIPDMARHLRELRDATDAMNEGGPPTRSRRGPPRKTPRRPTGPHGARAVPTARGGFTAVLGVGTGVGPLPTPPETQNQKVMDNSRAISW